VAGNPAERRTTDECYEEEIVALMTSLRGQLFGSLRGYQSSWLRSDVIAGLTVWAVLVPESLAYATIAGVSPVVGLYAAPGALILYAAFGSSRHLIAGPMAATAALSAAAVVQLTTRGSNDFVVLTVALAITTGIIAAAAGLLRLGFLASFISEPVLKGFIVGLALTIIAGQLPKIFGVEGADGNFFEKLWGFVSDLGDTNGWTLLVGLSSLAIMMVLKRVAPVVPGSLVAVVLGILVVLLFGIDRKGVEVVGTIQGGLPTIGLPHVSMRDYFSLVPPAVGVALVGFAEGLGAAKSYAARNHYEVDANRELLGLGAANLGSGLSGGMVVNGSLSKTAVNSGAGAKTELSGLVAAVLTIVTLLFLTGLFESLPEATLGAIVIAALIELVDISSLVSFYRVWTRRLGSIYGPAARPDFIAALAALAGVLIFDTLPGLFIGIAVSLLLLLYRASRPNVAVLGRVPGTPHHWTDVARNPDNERVPGVVVLRVESGLFFANSDHVRDAVRARVDEEKARAVVLDAQTVPFVDVTAAEMLNALQEDLSGRGVSLLLARDVGQVRDVLRRTRPDDGTSERRVFATVEKAVQAASSPRSEDAPNSSSSDAQRGK
jgi:sulfate permease, SulP family